MPNPVIPHPRLRSLLRRLWALGSADRQRPVVVVSGLPRSGTSLAMQMLRAGGMELICDGLRPADEDNPRGYLEFERAKNITTDTAWLAEAAGKAVKMISMLLLDLPPDYRYKVIFLKREMTEILASQTRMLARRGESTDTDDRDMATYFQAHLRKTECWLATQPNIDTLFINYSEAINKPKRTARRINRHLGGLLDTDAMAAAVAPALHRNRTPPDAPRV